MGGRSSVRDHHHLLTDEEVSLRESLIAEGHSGFTDSYTRTCDLLQAWSNSDLVNDDEHYQLAPVRRAILVRLGFAIDSLASHGFSTAYELDTILRHETTVHPYHHPMHQRPWRNLVIDPSEDDRCGLGYTVFRVIPQSLAGIIGRISRHCARPERWEKIVGGGGQDVSS
mmetsp:Transcript_46137/g.62753  ORF Transcript_46137/g.62753 Transcript_46137/m.62753 type:complete len:170 (+) Transcript_46137:2046-2555(+)